MTKKSFEIKEVYTIYDVKSQVHHPPFVVFSKNEALRMFTDMANDPKSTISRHPEDYLLFHIADFNQVTGSIVPLETPYKMAVASSLVEEK